MEIIQNGKYINWQVDYMANRLNGNQTKWQVYKMDIIQNGKYTK